MINKRILDSELKNVATITVFVMVQCVQIIIILALIFSFIPQPPNDFVKTIFRNHQGGVLPEREMLFYRLFVCLAMLGQAFSIWISRRFFKGELPLLRLWEFMLVELIFIGLQIFAVFKIFVFDNPWWARTLLYTGIGANVMVSVFWPEIRRMVTYIINWLGNHSEKSRAQLKSVADGVVIFVIGICIFIPDIERVLTRAFFWDQFNRFDVALAAPGWTIFQCGHLSASTIASSGFLLPWITTVMSHMFGFSYTALAQMMVVFTFIYMIGIYIVLRLMTKSVALSTIGVLWAIKLKLFHQGVFPLVFIDPSITPMAHFWDLFFLLALVEHSRSSRKIYLWLAAVTAGVMLAYAPLWAIAMLLAFYFYITGIFLEQSERENWGSLRERCLLSLLPIFTGLILVLIFAPSILFDAHMRAEIFQQLHFVRYGFSALPMYFGLKDRQFFPYFFGYIVVLIYLLVVSIGIYRRILSDRSRELFAVASVSVYGLGLLIQYVYHSSVAYYHVFSIPFVITVTFVIQQLLKYCSQDIRRWIVVFGFIWTVMALLTSQLFTYYPNVLSLARNDWETEKNLYYQQESLHKDAQLIQELTPSGKDAAVISSFETKLLVLAQRKSFFEQCPLVVSSQMLKPEFLGLRIISRKQLENVMSRLQNQAPEYLFIERKLFKRQIHPLFFQYFESLETIVAFLGEHYEPQREGQYLLALKKKQGKE